MFRTGSAWEKFAKQPPSSVIRRPSVVLWLALVALALPGAVYLRLVWLAGERLDIFHAAFFDSCTNQVYQLHWQNTRRYPSDMRGDFIVSRRSFVLLEMWFANGPAFRFGQILPLGCLGGAP